MVMILKNGADGAMKNVARAASLYERAIDGGCDCSALNNLAKPLQSEKERMEKNEARSCFSL